MKLTANNTATPSVNLLGRPDSPKVAYVLDHPTLKSLTGTHPVKPGGISGVARRLYNIRLVLSDAQRATLVSRAKTDGYDRGGYPVTPPPKPSTSAFRFPFPNQAELTSKIVIKRPNKVLLHEGTNPPTRFVPAGYFKVKTLSSTQEKMQFPGTDTVMDVQVSEQYETRLKKSTPTELKPALTTPKHVGTVGSFDLADRYVIHRQLEPAPGAMQKIKRFFGFGSASTARSGPEPKRRLVILAHGSEPNYDHYDRQTGDLVSKDFALPRDMGLSHGAPSAKSVTNISPLNHNARFKTMSDVVKEMPAFSRQRMSGSTHMIEFCGPVIARKNRTRDVRGVVMPVDASKLFEMATGLTPITGHGRARNQTLTQVEDLRAEDAQSGTTYRNWSNSQQRGTVTHDAVTFAAMETSATGERVDILTIKPGRQGNLADLITKLKEKGINYDEINSQACRNQNEIVRLIQGTAMTMHGDGSNTIWPATDNVHAASGNGQRHGSPTIITFDNRNVPRIDVASPHHRSQLDDTSNGLPKTDPIAFLGAANLSRELQDLLTPPPESDLINYFGAENLSTALKDFLK